MHDNFIKLEQEKRDKIINAAMREFAAKGFKNASTNEIVKKAEISKGALFHYFSSKQALFEFLYRYSVDFLMEAIVPHLDDMPTDIFERLLAFSVYKVKVAAQYPDMSDFMQMAYREDAPEAQGLLADAFEQVSQDFSQKIYDGIDFSKFKSDIDVQKALQIIWWVLEGYALSFRKEPFDLAKIKSDELVQTLICEIASYLDMLKKSFYREEYLK